MFCGKIPKRTLQKFIYSNPVVQYPYPIDMQTSNDSRNTLYILSLRWPPLRPTQRWVMPKLVEQVLITEKNLMHLRRMFSKKFQKKLKGSHMPPVPTKGIRPTPDGGLSRVMTFYQIFWF